MAAGTTGATGLGAGFRELMTVGSRSLGIELDDRALDRFGIYMRELTDWGSRQNLTAIKEPGEVATRHFLDSLTCCAAYDFTQSRPVIDVGTGAGFPGLALKIAFPHIPLTLLDAAQKKVLFLQHVCREMGFDDVDVVQARAELFGHVGTYRQRFNLAISRAVAPLGVLAEYCLPFVSVGGWFIAQKNLDMGQEMEEGRAALPLLGGGIPEIIPVVTPVAGLQRSIIRVRKESPTPYTYPRRPGIPAKRPLGRTGPGNPKFD